ncbi:MAG: pyridoxamine 5'-phosphate oxidase family protein [Pseudomonadota bacterium]
MPVDTKQQVVENRDALREVVGQPMALAATKEMPRLDRHCRAFIALSPFLCMGTMSADGKADVSPRGDPPGFVKVLDDRTVLIPDRPGNRRADSMTNLLANPSIGLIFFVPGVEETLRLNGRATIVRDAALLADMAVNGKAPKLAIRVAIDEVFFHCAKALKRSRLWDPETRIERAAFPRYAQIIRDQRDTGKTVEEIDAFIQDNYRNELY